MPMTKASVRALDTISDLTKSKIGEKTDRFVVAGKSKRGGISWMVGAVDKRVVAIVPIVMDLLNMQENLRHYYRSLGGWSFAFNDYYEVNFTQYLDSPYLKQMATIVDPLSYTHRYGDKPKYIILAGNDELFMPDDSRFYFDDLKGEIYFRMAPNMDHTLNPFENNTALGIRSFYISIMKNIPLPKMNWKLQMTSTGGKISLITEKRPAAVVCYHATTTDGKRKDFRLFRLNNDNVPALNQVIWHKADVNQTSALSWEVELLNPPVGWTAFFIQVTFAGLADSVLEFTTQTLIIPDTVLKKDIENSVDPDETPHNAACSPMSLNRTTFLIALSMRCILAYICVALLLPGGWTTPLDDYVYREDPTYKYDVIQTYPGEGYTMYIVNLTSQTWKPDLQSQPVWWHYMVVTVPDKILIKGAGFLFIGGGSNENDPPLPTDEDVKHTTIIAATTGTVAACLKMIPNQPIVFRDDPAQKKRAEDAIIAWTWKIFVDQKGADPEILLRMPMTKASIRALDTINNLTQSMIGETTDRFMVAGGSKRGWTTWTVGAVDKRVVAIAPIVMDLLNLQENLHHYYRSLGGWTYAFDDYYENNFTLNLDSPYIKDMAAIVDPISYTDRYVDKPKYIISAGGDQFFMPDDSRFYFDKLKGEKYFRMVPNTGHGLDPFELSVIFGIRAFYLSVMNNNTLPKMKWHLETTSAGGKISLVTEIQPATVVCYHATTSDGKRKDFRITRLDNSSQPVANPVPWYTADVKQTSALSWEVELPNPPVGWTAFFIQVTFAGLDDSVLEFTTQTLIIPNTYPFPDCHGAECRGTLV
ncbi:hypothetical protein DPMN_035212 [Dreissena polymorpha]|nr:hypothetical protein DPMN_035212 [Dreissena polymorpha]